MQGSPCNWGRVLVTVWQITLHARVLLDKLIRSCNPQFYCLHQKRPPHKSLSYDHYIHKFTIFEPGRYLTVFWSKILRLHTKYWYILLGNCKDWAVDYSKKSVNFKQTARLHNLFTAERTWNPAPLCAVHALKT